MDDRAQPFRESLQVEYAELCRVVAAQIGGTAFWYEPDQIRQELPEALLRHPGDQKWSEASRKKLLAFFLSVSPEEGEGTLVVPTDEGPSARWFRLCYTWMGRGAVVSVQDVTEQRELLLLGHICRGNWNIPGIKANLFCCVADLTRDQVLHDFHGAREGTHYSSVAAKLCQQYVDPWDRRTCLSMLSRSGLLAREARGETSVERTVRPAAGCGLNGRLLIRVDMVREPYSGNLCARLFLGLQEEAAAAGGELRNQLPWDDTTGAYRREVFLAQLVSRQGEGTLVVIRVDQLDQVNDVLGSRMGDQVLRELTRTLTALLREDEFLGRYGGAEFLMYLSQTSQELLEERLRIVCSVLHRELEQGIQVSVHLGAVPLGGQEESFDDLFEKARLALRSVRWKKEGGFAFYTPQMRELRKQTASPALPKGGAPDSRIFVRTFGYFDVFVDGVPIHFQGSQAKELMALLVDRRGGYLSSGEAIACLWENEPATKVTLARLRKVAMRLKCSLEEAGIADIMESKSGERRVVPEKFNCDYYDFLANGPSSGKVFPGAYMTNYSWAETTLANLTHEK